MESQLKTKLVSLVLLLLLGCGGPKALITDRNGEVTFVKKLKSDGSPLLFRRDGFTSELALKKLSSITVTSETAIYEGDTWNAAVVIYKKDEKQVPYKGWLKSTSLLTANCPAGSCQFFVPSLAKIDLLMEEAETEATADDNATPAVE